MTRILNFLVLLTACNFQPSSTETCLPLSIPQGEPVAQVGQTILTQDEILRRIEEQGTQAQRKYQNQHLLKTFIEDQIRVELMTHAAFERGLQHDPDVVDAARKVMVRKLLQRDFRASETENVPDELLRTYYDGHKTDYQQPAMRRFRHIQLSDTDAGKAQAITFIQALASSDVTLFAELATKHSIDSTTKYLGGETPYLSAQDMERIYGPELTQKIFQLKPGQILKEPVHSSHGWHALQFISQRDPLTRSYEDVREEIRDKLTQSKRSQNLENNLQEVRSRYPVLLYEDKLASIVSLLKAKHP